MKFIVLILGFVFILFSGFLFYSDGQIEAFQKFKAFYWIPVDIGIVLFVVSFLLHQAPKKS